MVLKTVCGFLSEVMSILSFKIRKFNGRRIWGKRRKNVDLFKILSRERATRGREAPDANPIFKIWGQQPVHTSLPFSPFGVQRKPYTSERWRRELSGWVGGWEGDQKCPSIFLIFKYVNKQDFLISNMVSKVVNDLCTGLKIWFEVGLSCGLGFTFFDLPYLPGFWNLFSKLNFLYAVEPFFGNLQYFFTKFWNEFENLRSITHWENG